MKPPRPRKQSASAANGRASTASLRFRGYRPLRKAQAQAPKVSRSWRGVCKIHPALEAIPSLGATEVRALAESIRQHGLLTPIHMATVNGVTYLIDGRGRLDALELLGWQLVVNEKGEWKGYMVAKEVQP